MTTLAAGREATNLSMLSILIKERSPILTAASSPRAAEEIAKLKETDRLLCGLDKLGMAHDAQGNGFVHVTCPWDASHSVRDDRTGYNPHTKTFTCHHT